MRRVIKQSAYVVTQKGERRPISDSQLLLLFGAPRKTLRELAAEFIAEAKAERQKPGYVRLKERTLERFILPEFGDRNCASFSASDVVRMKQLLGHLHGKTANNVLCVFRKLLKMAYRQGLLSVPLEVRNLPAPKPKAEFYTLGELTALLEATRRNPTWRALLLLGAHAGLRRGEIIGLEWRDVDFETGTLHIERSSVTGHISTPKSGRSRQLPMSRDLSDALAALPRDAEWVFCTLSGARASHVWLYRQMAQLVRAAGIKGKGRLHVLRHTFCSHLAMKGVPVVTIKELAGHSTTMVTERYMHLQNDQKKSAVLLLDSKAKSEHFARRKRNARQE